MAPKTKASEDEWRERIELWKRTFMKGASDDELVLFEEICKRTGLSPEMKQIHAIPREDYKLKKTVFTFQVSIDGYRLLADRTGKYAPGREPTFNYDKDGMLLSATSYVKKLTSDGTWHEVGATAFYNEYVQTFKDKDTGKQEPTKFWKQSEHNQLAKCAEALALRKAFPADLGNIYTVDEMAQALNEANGAIISQETTVDNTPEFKDAFKPIENMDYDLNDFLKHICETSKKPIEDAITQALKHSDRFSKSYLKWVDEKIAGEKKAVDVKAEQGDLLK
jgi:phage recombination protein Bet